MTQDHLLLHLSCNRGAFGWLYFCQELGISWADVCLDFAFFLGSVVSGVVFLSYSCLLVLVCG